MAEAEDLAEEFTFIRIWVLAKYAQLPTFGRWSRTLVDLYFLLTSVLWYCDMKGIWPIQTTHATSYNSKIFFWNKWRKKTARTG